MNDLNKMFMTGSEKERASLYLNLPIIEALRTISEKTGKSISELAAGFLDKQLTELVKLGYLEAPKGTQKSTSASKGSKTKAKGA